MRRVWTALLAALVIVMALLSVPAVAATGGTVSGVVRDAAGNPVQGFSITFGFTGPTTDANGAYSITVPAGQYSAMVGGVLSNGTSKYTVTGVWNVDVTGDMVENFTLPAIVPLNLTMQNSHGSAQVNATMDTPQSEVRSTFPDGSTLRLDGAPMHFTSDPPFKTDGNGQITFPALIGSTTTITTDLPNVLPLLQTVAVPHNPTSATVQLPPIYTLSGNAASLPNGTVRITGNGSYIQTQASGGPLQSPGNYGVWVPAGTYSVDMGGSSSGFGFDMQGSVTVTGNTEFSAPLPQSVPIRVHLQHPDGSPAVEASVTSTDSSTTLTSSANTPISVSAHDGAVATPDANGLATTAALPGVSTTITVAEPNESPATSTMTSPTAATDPSGPADTTITVTPAGSQPQPTATVSGVVSSDTGQPLSGAQVVLRSSATNTNVITSTANDGSWAANVVPGSVSINVSYNAPMPGSPPSGSSVGPSYTLSASGTLSVATTTTQDISLPSVDQFTVKVVDASDGPIPGVHIFAGGFSSRHQTMGGVDFTVGGFASPPGTTSDSNGELTLYALDNSTVTGSIQQGSGYVVPLNLDVTTPATDPIIRLDWFGSVQSQGTSPGQVTISAAPGVTLTQLSSTPATTTPDGQSALVGNVSYEVSGITPGSTQEVTLTLPAGSQPTNVFKVAGDGTAVDATSHSTITGNTIVMHLTDGGFGDADGVANGVIVDPLMPTASMMKPTTVQPATPGYPTAVNAGSPYTFKGVIRSNGTALAGARVRLMIRKLGGTAWGQIGSSVSDSNGNLTVTFTPTKNSQMMWQYDGAPGYGTSTSSGSLREVDVRPTISLMGVRGSIQLGTTTTLWGIMWPGLSGERVTLQKMVNGVAVSLPLTAIVKRQVLPTGVVGYGFIMPFRPTSRGTVVYRVLTQRDNNFMAAASGGARLTVW